MEVTIFRFFPSYRIVGACLKQSFGLVLSVVLLLAQLFQPVSCRDLTDIYWNSSNPIFRIDNTDHVISVRIRDRLNIICPFYDQTSFNDPSSIEYSEIYSVSKKGYDNCQLDEDAKIVGVCVQPFKSSPITIVFREFTPKPGGLEFKPGQNYYFISTSTGSLDGIQSKQAGLCLTENMKLKFEVHSFSSEERPVVEQAASPDQVLVNHLDDSNRGSAREELGRWHSSNNKSSDLTAPGNPVLGSGTGSASGEVPDSQQQELLYVIHTRIPPQVQQQLQQPDSTGDNSQHGSYVINEEYYPNPSSTKLERRTSNNAPSTLLHSQQLLFYSLLLLVLLYFLR